MLSSRSIKRLLTVLLVTGLALSIATVLPAEDKIPRTASGRPDLTGTYDAATLTPLVRPKEYGDNLYLTAEEAEKIAEEERLRTEKSSAASNPDRDAPPDGGDGSPGAAGNVGGYNSFWIDRGTDAFDVGGKFRTSIIIDPKNGQMPPMTAAAKESRAKRFSGFARRGNDGTAWWLEKGDGSGPYDNVEMRSHAERCMLGFTGATPTFPSLYNNFKRIVQTEDHVMILIEMVHDARIVRMNSEHLPASETSWLGDSIGWWEGDTLVIDSTNFNPAARNRGGSGHVVERFTRLEDGNVLYNFTMEDDQVWETPWTGEYLWKASEQKVFEYACHEGNYSLGNILRGARILEQDVLKGKQNASR